MRKKRSSKTQGGRKKAKSASEFKKIWRGLDKLREDIQELKELNETADHGDDVSDVIEALAGLEDARKRADRAMRNAFPKSRRRS